MLIAHEIKSIFQSERDRLRNADHPSLMRPKNNRKPLKGVARVLYLEGKAKLNKAEELATSSALESFAFLSRYRRRATPFKGLRLFFGRIICGSSALRKRSRCD